MDPLQEYSARHARRQAEELSLKRQFIKIGNARLILAIFTIFLAWLIYGAHKAAPSLLFLPLGAFVALVIWHQRVIRRRTLASRAVAYYVSALLRLKDNWMGKGSSGDQFRNDEHVYASDLDLFGKGSLFELISCARTGPGESTLAQWFSAPANLEEALTRQEAIRELSPRLDLREDIAILGEDVRSGVHADAVAEWGARPPVGFPTWLRGTAFALSLTAISTFLAFFFHLLPLFPFLLVLVCNLALMFALRERVERIMAGVETPAQDLRILSLVLERLERESFDSARLRRINELLKTNGQPASKRIAGLQRWMEWLDSSDHLLVKIIRPVLLWNEQCSLAIETWRQKNGAHVGHWLRAVGEFEALSSLAALTFERPYWRFPDLLTESAIFEAKELRHPLLPHATCVPNDVAVRDDLRLLIISGSNMSGKSTLLRAVGLNAVLAWAGAPVPAAQLRVSPLQVGASLRITDSLQDNRSRFYAEITRLRRIVDLSKQQPSALFLLDELLSGTNSHDRRIGASAIVRNLVENGAIGFITTHDLALAEIEQDLQGHAANAHFEDRITDGKIEFDYRLRPGIVTRSNALALMRAVGLAV
jgi:MutS domain V